MEAGGADPDEKIVGGDGLTIDETAFFDDTDAEAGEIIIVIAVEVGHDRGFTAEEAAIGLNATVGDTANDGFEEGRVVAGHGDIVEEEEGFGAGAEDIIDAHGDEIDPNRGVISSQLGDFELGADAIGTGNEERFFVVSGKEGASEIEGIQASKASIIADDAWGEGAVHPFRKPTHRFFV